MLACKRAIAPTQRKHGIAVVTIWPQPPTKSRGGCSEARLCLFPYLETITLVEHPRDANHAPEDCCGGCAAGGGGGHACASGAGPDPSAARGRDGDHHGH